MPQPIEPNSIIYPFSDTLPQPGATMNVAPGVHWVRMPLPLALNHINLWLTDDGDGWTVIDTGLRDKKIQELWEKLFDSELNGQPIARIIITHMHPDHIGLAGWLMERWQAEMVMTRTDWLMGRVLSEDKHDEPPPYIIDFHREMGLPEENVETLRSQGFGFYAKGVTPIPSQYIRIVDGDTLELGGVEWRVMVGEGHAPEHACLYSEELGILFAGDQILPSITPIIGVYPGEPEANPLYDFINSLAKFRELPEDTLVLPAHGRPFVGLHNRVDQLIEHHEERCQALVVHGEQPMSVFDSLPLLFNRPLEGQNVFMAMAEALAHFNHLIGQGRMVREKCKDGINRYTTIKRADAAS